MHVADAVRGAPRKRDRVFSDRERVAGVEADARMRSQGVHDLQQLLAAEILVILYSQDETRIGDAP
jgi:hypothetical protein